MGGDCGVGVVGEGGGAGGEVGKAVLWRISHTQM